MAPPIPEDIRRFVLTRIPTVPHLEALLLLRAGATEYWRSDQVAQRLYIGEKAADALLVDLCDGAMTVALDNPDGKIAYRYQPKSDFLRATIDSLAELYARQLVDVTHLIHSTLDRKAQQFADAFKWRKDS
jgi:hypothetical protein